MQSTLNDLEKEFKSINADMGVLITEFRLLGESMATLQGRIETKKLEAWKNGLITGTNDAARKAQENLVVQEELIELNKKQLEEMGLKVRESILRNRLELNDRLTRLHAIQSGVSLR